MNSEGKLPNVRFFLERVEDALEAFRATSVVARASGTRPRMRSRSSSGSGPHAARHAPGRVNLLPAERGDDLLAELAKPDPAARQLGLRGDQAEHVALRRIALQAEKQVGRAHVEEAQRVRLNDLGEVHQPAQLFRGGRRTHGENLIARLR